MLSSCQWYCIHAGAQLSAEWLSKGQRRVLAQQLDSLWREQGLGGPICFSWIDWLQNDALPFLGITERLLLTFMPHDPVPVQSSHGRLAAEAPRLPLPAQRMQPDGRALAHGKAAADKERDERQASQQLAGPADASQAHCASLQSSRMNEASHQAADRQQTQHQHFQVSGSRTKEQAPQRDHLGRQTADDCAAEQSSNAQLGMYKHISGSLSNHRASLNPNAHAWQPCGVQCCLRPELQAASEQGQGPGHLKGPGHEWAAVPAGEHLMQQTLQPEQSVSEAGIAKVRSSTPATGMAEAEQPWPASSHLAELEEPVSGTGTQGEHLEKVRAGSRATKSEQSLDPSSDMEQIAKLFTRLAAYSKMRDRELFKEVRKYHCLYGSA